MDTPFSALPADTRTDPFSAAFGDRRGTSGAREPETEPGPQATAVTNAMRGRQAVEAYAPHSIGRPYQGAAVEDRDTVAQDVIANIAHQLWAEHPYDHGETAAVVLGRASADLLAERDPSGGDPDSDTAERFIASFAAALRNRAGLQ